MRADRADDVVQQAMFAAWTALLGGAEITELRAWLHRVVHNAALDTVTKRGYDHEEIPDLTIAPALTDELAEGRLDARAALAAIAALPDGQRRALTLTAIEGQSGHDAALAMGMSESAMRQLVYRARSGIRAAVTAITPLPLVTWMVAGGGESATPAAVGLGAASGAATVAKVAAVIGGAAATLGATHALQGHHHARHTRNAPTSQAAMTTADRGRVTGGLAVQQGVADTQLAGGQHPQGGQNGSSQQGSGGNAGQQSGSQNAAGGTGSQQSGAQQQSATTEQTVTGRSGTTNASQQQPSNQGTSGTSSGQSGSDRSPAPQNGQSGNGN